MFTRYAIFYTPPAGAFADFGAGWLGWDSRLGAETHQPKVEGIDLEKITRRPRNYGFHATLKAPFRLAESASLDMLLTKAQSFAASHGAAPAVAMHAEFRHGFVALRPVSKTPAIDRLAGAVVRHFDPLRATLTDDEIMRRRGARLTARQDRHLLDWGYPFVFDDFDLHITLTGRVDAATAARLIDALHPRLSGVLPDPLIIDAITVMGAAPDGRFHQIDRFALVG